ncbi:transcription elongation factor SPT4-like protein 2-like [Micractinium conductrix]|uniref:Transcription elongation factor SPT4 homolog n=1 Tax=Micractinium conductrix TaxID=554055 RepID=A0A2P6VHW0_9CHLO|nr:transcription elongation factor SPT4-like protein 2-like [Micractinium conductrix]|eukprot:PSC73674.1 transcription elongation factor SPT4-like protein 2-like [Micractinium conductrix]
MADEGGDGDKLVAQPPTDLGKSLRCCVPCRLVKTFEQFYEQGCENCPFLEMEGDRERVFDCTTSEFKGMVSVVDPTSSWCAKWLHLRKAVPGCYALSVSAELPQHIEDILDNRGIKWRQPDM